MILDRKTIEDLRQSDEDLKNGDYEEFENVDDYIKSIETLLREKKENEK